MRHLNGNHVVFGELVDGEEVLDEIEKNASESGKPGANFTVDKCGEIINCEEPKTKQ